MAGSFQADPEAIATAGTKFTAEVEPINTLATKTEALQFSSGNAGRDYAAQGTAYHAALLTFIQTLLTPMATMASWAGSALAASAQDYRSQDAHARTGVTAAGQGA